MKKLKREGWKLMSGFLYGKDSDNIVTVTMDMPGETVNTMNAAFPGYMEETLARLEKEKDEITGVIITSAKESFFAGGDLKSLLTITEEDKPVFFNKINQMKSYLRRLETLGKPVVAAINGAALGGGYEICLATHYRIAQKNPKSEIGMPEVSLGLLPGGGGVVRMVRLFGLQNALPYLMEGKKLKPEKALEAGLVHELAENREDMMAKARAWILANPDAKQPWDQEKYKMPGGTPSSPAVAQMLAIAPAMLIKKTRGLMPAPEAILSAAVEGAQVDFDTAMRIESRYFTNLVVTPVAKNLINFFFQMNKVNAGDSRPKGIEKSKVKKLGILGAGMMGAGLAYVSAKAGIEVVLKDVSLENAEKGKSYSTQLLDKQIAKGRSTPEKKDGLLALIKPTADANDLAGCDLIIEAVFEDKDLKAKVTQEAEPFLNEGGVFASNTSTLPITGLAEASKNPELFIGLHFFSPVDKMPLVEIICGKKTNEKALALSFDFVQQIRKTPIVVNDSLGFYTSRVFGSFTDEGCALLEDGVNPIMIDNLSKLAGMPVGPLTILDEVSQQLVVKVRKANKKLLEAEGKKCEEVASDRVVKFVTEENGRNGKAYGGGFYDYPADGRKTVWPELTKHFFKADNKISFEDIKDRVIFRQVIEAVKCLEEGVLRSVQECNIGSIFGIGFPPHTGGQLQFINTYGINKFIGRANELAEKYGARFTPPALLLEKAEKREDFI
ncbi:MAG: 3-hydroxyacyl-CoA dehydrogenase NAD-binding domain-containing protein [Geobacteraceae bacterium]